MVVVVSAGQSGDSPMLPVLLDHLSVPRIGSGRPRTTPDRLRGDKAYSSRGHRSLLRARGIIATIPEPADQVANRKRRGSAGCGSPQIVEGLRLRGVRDGRCGGLLVVDR